MWKMYGKLNGTDRLHGNSKIDYHAVMIALDNFQFTMAIHTGQYISFDILSTSLCLMKTKTFCLA